MITVYSKNNCPYCVQAKTQLSNWGVEYQEVNIEEDAEARDFIINEGHRTMPQIYRNGKPFVKGGAQGLAKLTKDEVNTMLGNFDFDVSMKL